MMFYNARDAPGFIYAMLPAPNMNANQNIKS